MNKLLLALAAVLGLGAAQAATITIVNGNAPGVGFNDATPATPVGGNAGTTVGEQRLIAFQKAANLWGATLDSKAEIRVLATFEPLSCTATAATLGSAGAIQVFRDFPGAFEANTWYHVALADKLAGEDLDPTTAQIRARFNSDLGNPTGGTNGAGCLTSSGWYYGLDTGHAANQINLVTVLLHEFAHGLGFSSFASVTSGALLSGLMDRYSKFYLDNTTGKTREQMTDAERKTSAINPRNVVWTGPAVTAAVPSVLANGTPLLRITGPASAAGDYAVGAASFGPAITAAGLGGNIVVARDIANPSGPTTSDACTAITNAADVAGKIALVDRGTCGFVIKVKNAQNAGAIGVVVADNVAGGPPAGLGGADPTITIPSVRITLADGNKIKAALASSVVAGTLGLDMTLRAGADRAGHALLNTPDPVVSGSSVSHWDPIASPNQLMEPAINLDLTLSVASPQDLTRAQLRDMGWFPDADLDGVADDAGDQCLGSDLKPTIVIDGCDTGVVNTFFTNGCSSSDLVRDIRSQARNHGQFVSGVAALGNQLRKLGIVSDLQMGALQSCAAKAK